MSPPQGAAVGPDKTRDGSATATRAAWIAAATLVALHAHIVLLGRTFLVRDHLKFFTPLSAFAHEALAKGHLPEWCDYLALGTNAAASGTFGVAYPVAWIRGFLPPVFAADLLIVAHLALAAAGVAALSARLGARTPGAWLAGVLFASSGYLASTEVYLNILVGNAWTAWVGVAAHRLATTPSRPRPRDALALAMAFGMLGLGGDPSLILAGGLAGLAVVAACARERVRAMGLALAAGGVGAILAAGALLPALRFLPESERSGGLGVDEVTLWSMHPLRLVEAVWPRMLGNRDDELADLARIVADTGDATGGIGPSWATGALGGAAVLLAIVGARGASRGRALVAFAVLPVLLALGRYTPAFAAWRALVPVASLARYPHKYVVGAMVVACALAGVGHTRAFARARSPGVALAALVLAATLLGAGLAAPPVLGDAMAASGAGLAPPVDVSRALADAREGAVEAAALLGALVALLAWPASARARRAASLAAAILVAAGAAGEAYRLEPTLARDEIHVVPAVVAPVVAAAARADGVRPRVYRPYGMPRAAAASTSPQDQARAFAATAYPNFAAAWGVAYQPAYDNARAARFRDFWAVAMSAADGGDVVARALGIDWALAQVAGTPPPGYVRAGVPDAPGGLALLQRTDARPRAFVASRARSVATEHEARAALFEPGRDLDEVVLAGAAAIPATGDARAPLVPCTVRAERPERVEVACDAPFAGWSVLLDAYLDGWTATVDGAPAPIAIADGVARAVWIPAGAHRVAYAFRAPGLRTGMLVSWVGWLACALATLAWHLGARRAGPPRG